MNDRNKVPIDVGAMIDAALWSAFQKWVLCLISLAFIVDSLANNVLSVSIPAMMDEWQLKRAAFASVNAIGWVGVAIGTIVAGTLADKVGRKPMLLMSVLIFGLATVFGAMVTDINQLLILRAIDGFGIGGAIPTATTMLAEFTPVRRRSRAVVFGMISIPIGVFLSGIIGSFVLPTLGWRSLFLINGSLAILVAILLLFFVPESPCFLVRKINRRGDLSNVLKKMQIDVPVDVEWIDSSDQRKKGSLAELFGAGSLPMTLCLWGGFFFCFLASYTSLNWLPALLSSRGYGPGVSSLALSASGVGGIVASLATAKLIEALGSRIALIVPTLIASLAAALLMQMPFDPAQSATPVLLAIGLLGFSLNSLTCFVYSLGAFIYPPLIKGTGLGAAGSIGRIGAITSSYAGVAVLAVGSEAYFGFIAAAAVIAMGFLIAIKRQIPSDKNFDKAGQ